MSTKTNNRIGDYKLVQKVTIEVSIDTAIDVEHMRQSVMDALSFAGNVTMEEDMLVGIILSQIEEQLKPKK
jgi:hypothetical protein